MSPERKIQLLGKETGRVIVDEHLFDIDDTVPLTDIPTQLERDLKLAQTVLANSGGRYEPLVISIKERITEDPLG